MHSLRYTLPLACLTLLAPLAGAGDGVTHVRVEGMLDVGTLGLLERACDHAEAEGHGALILDIDTPGGEIELMWQLSRRLDRASEDGLLTTAWVHDRATSAGALLAISCERVYMSPASTIGSAAPVTPGPAGIAPVPEEGGVREKVTSLLRSQFRAVAERHGRPPALAEAMVDESVEVREVRHEGELKVIDATEWGDLRMSGDDVELVRTLVREGELLNATGTEAVGLGLADGSAASLEEVIDRIGLSGQPVVTLERSASEDTLAWLTMMSPILLMAGLWLGYTELKQPGFGAPGIGAVICFAVMLTGHWFVGLADIPHIVLVGVGLALLVVELFVMPGTIWIGLVGGVAVVLGLIAAQVGPGFTFADPLARSMALDASFHFMLLATVAMLGVVGLSKVLPDTPVLRHAVTGPTFEGTGFGEAVPEASYQVSVGDRGVTKTDLRPVGKVSLEAGGAKEYEARAAGEALEAGVAVVVVEAAGGRVVVELDKGGSA
ncbi:MAG: hypothetical protein MK291_07400 [Planctomycetes bacterium]|nr:hypothetical protein [Planctomycetota bacterium]